MWAEREAKWFAGKFGDVTSIPVGRGEQPIAGERNTTDARPFLAV